MERNRDCLCYIITQTLVKKANVFPAGPKQIDLTREVLRGQLNPFKNQSEKNDSITLYQLDRLPIRIHSKNLQIFGVSLTWKQVFRRRSVQDLTNWYSGFLIDDSFITIKSSLVPLIEGLCAQIYFRFEISVFCSHLLLFFFVKEKCVKRKQKGS